VDVTFRTRKLARICSTEGEMVRTFGPTLARQLKARLHELDEALTLAELRALPHVRPHQLKRDRDEQISLDLGHPLRLILEVNHEPVPRLHDGGLDWESITAVVITEVTDTHG
jgi:plasmid maintenance system killer protein